MALGLLAASCSKSKLTDPLDEKLAGKLNKLSPTGDSDYFVLPDSDDFASIPHEEQNPLTKEKVALGKMLFHETALAGGAMHEIGKYTYSCASCHIAEAGFTPGTKQGIADGGMDVGENRFMNDHYQPEELDVQSARALSLINVAFVSNTTWTGKFGAKGTNVGTEDVWDDFEDTKVNHLGLSGIESQLIEGQTLHRMVVDEYVLDGMGYRSMYDAAFPDIAESERYGAVPTAFAIAAYLRTIISNKAPFQKWLKGNYNAMTDIEKEGALLFYGKAGCFRCHKSGALNANEYHAIGVPDLYDLGETFETSPTDLRNFGRGGFTKRDEDLYKFRVPSIYNMRNGKYYFHGSSKHTLWGVVEYFNKAIPENPRIDRKYISPFFHPLNLSVIEVQQLVAFLSDGLYDEDISRYVPEYVLSGNCIPNNDSASKITMGCE